MSNKTKKERDTKDTHLSIRLKGKIKKMIEKRAEKSGKSISAYAEECFLAGMNKETDRERISKATVICQEICNHVEEKYCGDDEILEGLVAELWMIIL